MIKSNGGVFGRNPTFNDVTVDGNLTVNGDIALGDDIVVTDTLTVNGITTVANTTESTNKDTGALVVEGGVGIEKRLNVGGNAVINSIHVGTGTAAAPTTNTVVGNGAGTALGAGGTNNVLIGSTAGDGITDGGNNVAVGAGALGSASALSVVDCVAIGTGALSVNTTSSLVAVGTGALASSQTGAGQVAIGTRALNAHNGGAVNTAVGWNCLSVLTGSVHNTALGYNAGEGMTSGSNNVFIGSEVQFVNAGSNFTSAGNSVVIGRDARVNASGETNQIVIGYQGRGNGSNTTTIGNSSTLGTYLPNGTLYVQETDNSTSTTTGALVVSGGVGVAGSIRAGENCFVQGIRVGTGAFADSSNTALGTSALNANSSGVANTAIGSNALSAAQSANSNTAVGANALATATGGSNTAIGRDALSAATGGSNTAVGSQTMGQISSGADNTAIGWAALYANQDGVRNVAVGIDAGRYFGASPSTDAITTANDSVFIGATARANGNSQTNQVVIAGRNGVGNGSNTTTIGNSATTGTFIPAGNLTLSNGNLILGTSGNGIDFSATANSSGTMTSELLDDYEAGSWTPVLSDGTNNATMSSNNQGRYTKVGNMVTVWGYVETTSLGSVSGNLRITGLPFTAESLNIAYAAGNTVALGANLAITQYSAVSIRAHPNQTYCVPNVWDAATGTTVMQDTEWTADGNITFSFSYRAA